MNSSFLQPHLHEIEALCRHYQVLRLDVFGSVLRDDFNPESDVDLTPSVAYGILD